MGATCVRPRFSFCLALNCALFSSEKPITRPDPKAASAPDEEEFHFKDE